MNCSITKNYLKEIERMTNNCKIDCRDCPLSFLRNGENVKCDKFEAKYPDKAVKIVQQWSDEHPRKTLLDDLREKYPNYRTVNNEIPTFCPYILGYEENKQCKKFNCKECWNRPLDEVKK